MTAKSPCDSTSTLRRLRLALSFFAVFLLLLGCALYGGIRIYLATQHAADRLSSLLTNIVGTPVHITALHETGGAISFKGVTIANPPGYSSHNILQLRSISIRPAWTSLLAAPRSIRNITIDGFAINLEKNQSGWNYARIIKPGKKKEPGAEILISSVDVDGSSIQVNGLALSGIKAALADISTTGSRSTTFSMSAVPPTGSTIAVSGKFRGGPDPTVNVTLKAPQIPVEKAAEIFKRNLPKQLRGTIADIAATIDLNSGNVHLSSAATLASSGLKQNLKAKAAADITYRTAEDTAEIRSLSLVLNGLSVAATGTVSSMKKDRRFLFNIVPHPAELAELAPFVPPKLAMSGSVSCSPFTVEGSAATGITNLDGALSVEGANVSFDKTHVAGFSAKVKVAGNSSQIKATGAVHHEGPPLHALVDGVSATFESTFTPKLHLVSGNATVDSRLAGGSAAATASISASGISGSISASKLSLPTLIAAAGRRDVNSGILNLRTRFAGTSIHNIKGNASGTLTDATMRKGEVTHGISKMIVEGDWALKDNRVVFTGQAEAAGKSGDKQFRLDGRPHFENRTLRLDKISAGYGDMNLIAASLSMILPEKAATSPVYTATVNGASISSAVFAVNGINGSARFGKGVSGWQGSAAIVADSMAVRKAELGRQEVRLEVTERTAKAVILGAGGLLKANILADPTDIAGGITFSGALTDFRLATLSPLLAGKNPPQIREGLVGATFTGAWRKASGVAATATIGGHDVAIADSHGRVIFSGARVHAALEAAGPRLTIRDAAVNIGDAISVTAAATIDEYSSQRRSGKISFAVAPASANSLIDAFVNVLPPALQEATLTGTAGAAGEVVLKGGKTIVNGTVTAKAASIDIPGQKMLVSGIDGTIPFSVRPGDTEQPVTQQHANFSRETYRSNLSALMVKSATAQTAFKIEKITFGATTLGPLTLALHAADGTTYIDLLTADLYDGRLIGSGHLSFGGTQQFTFNSLVNDFSLKQLCDTYPAIKGYISGRVDGIVSFAGTGFKIPAMKGFLDLWTLEKKGEKKFVSKEFLQKISGKKLKGIFFTNDRPYDTGEIGAYLDDGFLTFTKLDLNHTNLFGVRDLSVSVAPVQNRISFAHLLESIKEAAARGKAVKGGGGEDGAPPAAEFKWQE